MSIAHGMTLVIKNKVTISKVGQIFAKIHQKCKKQLLAAKIAPMMKSNSTLHSNC